MTMAVRRPVRRPQTTNKNKTAPLPGSPLSAASELGAKREVAEKLMTRVSNHHRSPSFVFRT
jgi:hypothetical protein